MATLHLVLKKKWYDMIESGIKKEEYRDISYHWMSRLIMINSYGNSHCPHWHNLTKQEAEEFDNVGGLSNSIRSCNDLKIRIFHYVVFHYGYTKKKMMFDIDSISIGPGKPEWGAEDGKEYFIIKLGDRLD